MRAHKLDLVCLAAAAAALVATLCDYTRCFEHFEVHDIFFLNALARGPRLGLGDLVTFLNPALGADNRPRFYSQVAWVLDGKLRLWLFQYVPYHPSVSVIWPLMLLLLPWAVYRLLRSWTGDRGIGLSGAALLLVTQGYLSGYTMYFHSSKPMTLLFVALGLLQVERLHCREALRPRDFFGWFAVVVGGLFWDELYYPYFLVVPLFFPGIFRNRRFLAGAVAVYAAAFGVFCAIMFWLGPVLLNRYWQYPFDFLGYAFRENHNLLHSSAADLGYNFRSIFSTHVDPFSARDEYHWAPGRWNLLALGLFAAACAAAAWVKSTLRRRFLASLAAMAVFVLFQHLVLTRREGRLLNGAFYWGAPFSLYFVLAFGLLSGVVKERLPRWGDGLRLGLFVWFAAAGLANSWGASMGHAASAARTSPTWEMPLTSDFRALSFGQVEAVWRLRDHPEQALAQMAGYPANAWWLYREVGLHLEHHRP